MNIASSIFFTIQSLIQTPGNSFDSVAEEIEKQQELKKEMEKTEIIENQALSELKAEEQLLQDLEEDRSINKEEESITTEELAKEMDLNCQACDENHIATFKCVDCGDILMCEFMSLSHSKGKLTKSHRIEKLSNLLTVPSTQKEAKSADNGSPTKKNAVSTSTPLPPESLVIILCPQHNDIYRYYDADCGIVICRDCYALLHNGHKCVAISEATADFHSSLTTVCHDMKEKTNALCTAETLVVEISDKLDSRYSELNGQINKEFKEVYLFACLSSLFSSYFLLLLYGIDILTSSFVVLSLSFLGFLLLNSLSV
jgi:hypothetical protein